MTNEQLWQMTSDNEKLGRLQNEAKAAAKRYRDGINSVFRDGDRVQFRYNCRQTGYSEGVVVTTEWGDGHVLVHPDNGGRPVHKHWSEVRKIHDQ